MSESYQTVPPQGSRAVDPKPIADLLAKEGQRIPPWLDLIEAARCALDDLIDVMGRDTIHSDHDVRAVLVLKQFTGACSAAPRARPAGGSKTTRFKHLPELPECDKKHPIRAVGVRHVLNNQSMMSFGDRNIWLSTTHMMHWDAGWHHGKILKPETIRQESRVYRASLRHRMPGQVQRRQVRKVLRGEMGDK